MSYFMLSWLICGVISFIIMLSENHKRFINGIREREYPLDDTLGMKIATYIAFAIFYALIFVCLLVSGYISLIIKLIRLVSNRCR